MPFPQPPLNSAIENLAGAGSKIKAVWQSWFQLVQIYLAGLTGSGPTSARPTANLWVGQPFFDTTINVPIYWDGSTWVTSSPTGTVTAVTGTSPIASSGGTTPNISITEANATTNGYLSAADWNTFNNKQPSGTYVNSVGGTAPVVSSGGTSPVISMAAANGTTNGYLTSTDWNTFNNAASYGTYINVQKYGADPGGTVDSTTAIQNAINANPYRTLYFPAGRYLVSSLTCSTGMSFVGDNQNSSAIVATSSTGDVLSISTQSACFFQNITFTTNPTRSSGSYISISASSGENSYSCFINCGFISGYDGIHFVKASHFRITSCQFQQQSGASTIVENQYDIDSGDSAIVSSLYSMASGGIGINQYSSGGLKVIGCKFLGGLYHYIGQFVTGSGSSSSTSIFVFTGNSTESASASNIAINTTSNSFSGVNISGNQITVSGSIGIQTVGTQLTNTYIGGNEFAVQPSSKAISIAGGDGIAIGTNNINGQGGSSGGIGIYGSASVYVCPQSMTNLASRYISYTANTIFTASQMQTGSMPLAFTTTLYGVPGVYYGDTSQTFATAFQGTPAVNAYIYDPSGISGAVGVQLKSVSSTGFDVRVIGYNSSGAVTIYYTAILSG